MVSPLSCFEFYWGRSLAISFETCGCSMVMQRYRLWTKNDFISQFLDLVAQINIFTKHEIAFVPLTSLLEHVSPDKKKSAADHVYLMFYRHIAMGQMVSAKNPG